MVKKIAALAGAGALLLSVAVPAFADFTLIKNKAKVKNIVVTKADTGDNSIHGKYVFGGDILTGDATAWAEVYNDVNYSEVDADGVVVIKNKAKVKNVVITKADTGDNSVHGKVVCGGDIDTGNAGAGSIVTNVINWSIVGE